MNTRLNLHVEQPVFICAPERLAFLVRCLHYLLRESGCLKVCGLNSEGFDTLQSLNSADGNRAGCRVRRIVQAKSSETPIAAMPIAGFLAAKSIWACQTPLSGEICDTSALCFFISSFACLHPCLSCTSLPRSSTVCDLNQHIFLCGVHA